MNKFSAFEYCTLVGKLNYLESMYSQRVQEFGGMPVSDDMLASAKEVIGSADSLAKTLGYQECTDTLHRCLLNLHDRHKPIVAAAVLNELKHVDSAVVREVFYRTFLAVAKERSRYVDSAALLGTAVYEAFPSARYDITEAVIAWLRSATQPRSFT